MSLLDLYFLIPWLQPKEFMQTTTSKNKPNLGIISTTQTLNKCEENIYMNTLTIVSRLTLNPS